MLRRTLWPILGTALLGGLLAYGLSSLQKPQYKASTSLAALSGVTGNSVVNTTLVAASPLPQSVVQTALRSQKVLDLAIGRIRDSSLSGPQKASLIDELRSEAANGRYSHVQMLASIDPQQQTGTYEISGFANTPLAAQVIANSTAEALLIWDRERAAQNITRAQQTLKQQLANVNMRLAKHTADIEMRSLLSAHNDLQEKLGQISALLSAVSGTLTPISEASLPTVPLSPQPRRNALLTFLALLFFASLTALVMDTLRKKINSANDLVPLSRPLLGALPNFKQEITNILEEMGSGKLFENMGFIRVNLFSVAAGGRHFAISSAQPGEGKSTLTAALAVNIAQNGQKVLIVDADVYHPAQLRLWPQTNTQSPLSISQVQDGARLFSEMIHGVDLLVLDRSAGNATTVTRFQDLLNSLADQYDVVLVDTPSMLMASSTLELAAHLDGLIMVVDAGTDLEPVEQALRNAEMAGSQVTGLVLNRAKREKGIYGYKSEKASAPHKSVQPLAERS